ncbi:uncharacterized protein [Bemisia tabaci]|uniref:uncharacterized protein n=1 Tax=Bemisia tabaci TaxID=7038 RepID=UPI003B28A532
MSPASPLQMSQGVLHQILEDAKELKGGELERSHEKSLDTFEGYFHKAAEETGAHIKREAEDWETQSQETEVQARSQEMTEEWNKQDCESEWRLLQEVAKPETQQMEKAADLDASFKQIVADKARQGRGKREIEDRESQETEIQVERGWERQEREMESPSKENADAWEEKRGKIEEIRKWLETLL